MHQDLADAAAKVTKLLSFTELQGNRGCLSAPSPDKSAAVESPYCSCRARLAAPGFPAKALKTGVLTAGHPAHAEVTK